MFKNKSFKIRPNLGLKLFVNIIVATTGIVVLFPFYWMITLSFKENSEIVRFPVTFYPHHWTLNNFIELFSKTEYLIWLKNSAIITSITTLLVLFTSALAGFAFSKIKFRGKDTLFIILLLSTMIPFNVIVIPLYILINWLHLGQSLLAIIIPGVASAVGIFMMKQFIAEIPDSLINAAKIEGANDFTIFKKIILPLSKPGLGALSIITFLGSWNSFFWPSIVLHDHDKMTIPVGLSLIVQFSPGHEVPYALAMAGSTITSVPIIIVFIFMQKKYINTLSLSTGKD